MMKPNVSTAAVQLRMMMEVKQTAHGMAKGVTLNVTVETEAMTVIMMGAGETVLGEEVVEETSPGVEEEVEAAAVTAEAVMEGVTAEAGAVVEGMGVAAEVAEVAVAVAVEGVAVAMDFHIRDHPI
jgi:hypothetical protein